MIITVFLSHFIIRFDCFFQFFKFRKQKRHRFICKLPVRKPAEPINPVAFLQNIEIAVIRDNKIFYRFLQMIIFIHKRRNKMIAHGGKHRSEEAAVFTGLMLFDHFNKIIRYQKFQICAVLMRKRPHGAVIPCGVHIIRFIKHIFKKLTGNTEQPLLVAVQFRQSQFFIHIIKAYIGNIICNAHFLYYKPYKEYIRSCEFKLFHGGINALTINFIIIYSTDGFYYGAAAIAVINRNGIRQNCVAVTVAQNGNNPFQPCLVFYQPRINRCYPVKFTVFSP